jgi:hypothetical protein
MKGFVTAVKGVSASGKSSRVYQLIKFFETLGLEKTGFDYLNVEGKTKDIGIYFPEVQILFLGKEYNSGEITRFQGYDAVTSAFVKSAHFSDFLKDNRDINVIVEGAGVTQTNRLRPLFLREYCQVEKIYVQYYNFKEDQKQQYDERLILRSGKVASIGTMWEKCVSFNKEYGFSLNEKEALDDDQNITVMWDPYTADITDFGLKYLVLANMEELCEDFVNFVDEFDYISKNKFENFKK